MQVALYARVSTPNQQQEGTISSQIQLLKQHIQQQQWALLPEHEYIDDGVSGARLDRPALDRLRDCAGRGEFDSVVILAPDRLAREYAHQWLLVEEFHKLNISLVFLQNPFGDTPQGKLLTQMQGMIAEYERAQILERTRRGRLEKARRGEFMPWAYNCYGYRYLPKHFGTLPQVMIEPTEAEVVRGIYCALVEEQLSCRQITKRLNQTRTTTPSGKNQVWQPATVRNILTNQTYAGTARYNHRQPVLPQYRKTDESKLRDLKTGRSYRPESEWVLTEAPALITPELFEKAQLQLQRNATAARKMYKAASRRYLLRTLVKCGECGLSMVCIRQHSVCKKYEYLYYECKGHAPLTVGRTTRCQARNVRADRLDEVVWQALTNLLQKPEVIPQLHQNWAAAKSQNLSGLEAQQTQLQQRCGRLERQDQRLLDAYQSEAINLAELQVRRQKLATERQQIEQEMRQLAETRQQTVHWQTVIENAETFRTLLGDNLARLSFEERQAVAQCLIKKVIVTGEEVDVHFVLPFESTPQTIPHTTKESEGAPRTFYRLRLADFNAPSFFVFHGWL
jgi:site-specific DNA recombinase